VRLSVYFGIAGVSALVFKILYIIMHLRVYIHLGSRNLEISSLKLLFKLMEQFTSGVHRKE
jgi:hypothetical protein